MFPMVPIPQLPEIIPDQKLKKNILKALCCHIVYILQKLVRLKAEHQLYFTRTAISTEKNKNKYIFNGEYYDWELIQKVGFST